MGILVLNLFYLDLRTVLKKMKFSIFFSKCDQICSFLQIWLHLLKKSLKENFIFCGSKWVVLEKTFEHGKMRCLFEECVCHRNYLWN